MSIEQVTRESMGISSAVFVPSDDGLRTSLQSLVFIDLPRMAAEEAGEE
jgi:hypothetical protein